ncbi:hypothetical protein PFICI_01703 [Pestalotiopsis fici W106-1]|uniref:Zn(2)-C6 fungal-type domain-containing protein n=1 Tax=Pestalotiopsis fici (strain W106-1 / CGMCC3.15140) TaxID=1229662 RepID=W3XPI7_PESFW|nr:uncharacterized protein PFICI_01703 [Pestalotiopsis fici W106-1]ETS87875.1 hypothetical protein PFICI_01703 [Pestalotiopsis fici W106-1]
MSPHAQGSKRVIAPDHNHERAKRGKYALVACDRCRDRKTKCYRSPSSNDCQSCLGAETDCTYSQAGGGGDRQSSTTRTSASRAQQQSRAEKRHGNTNADDELIRLKEQVKRLTDCVKDLQNKMQTVATADTSSPRNDRTYTSKKQDSSEPHQPLFVGHTRSQYSLDVAKTSLVEKGLSSNDALQSSVIPSAMPSPRAQSAEPSNDGASAGDRGSTDDPLLDFSRAEIARLIGVFQEEVETIYPFVESGKLADSLGETLSGLQSGNHDSRDGIGDGTNHGTFGDIRVLKTILAVAIVIEAHGRNDVSRRLIESSGQTVARITESPSVDMRDLQSLAILSIYYFHSDEELLAWRTIGIAARMALEMGLHLKRSINENYKDPNQREMALKAFWCVYALDRRWSFGTGLPFSLNEKDIDPELPEPSESFQYLRCLIGYSRLASKVWESLPTFGPSATAVSSEKVEYLDFLAHKWSSSIPPDLQLLHPRLSLPQRSLPRTIRRLQTLLYLRGNHMRTLIHRHHVLSSSLIHADITNARLVVDIAKDSIQILVDLANTSDIYIRQQSAFNYFLLSALAIIFLAVCNAPEIFSAPCRESFSASISLIRGFSRSSLASKRLWRSIRGLVPAVKALGLELQNTHSTDPLSKDATRETDRSGDDCNMAQDLGWNVDPTAVDFMLSDMLPGNAASSRGSIPDVYQMSDDLMGLFDAFGQNKLGPIGEVLDSNDASQLGMTPGFPAEVSRRFQDLI